MITEARLKELLNYDPSTGEFRWNDRPHRKHVAGKIAGTCVSGYIRIEIDGRGYRAHRLAWLWVHGVYPSGQVDHINRVRTDNRIANLREATSSQNSANCGPYRTNRTGLKGAHFHARDKCWHAKIFVRGRHIYLGTFTSPLDAHEAYKAAAIKHFGDFARWQ